MPRLNTIKPLSLAISADLLTFSLYSITEPAQSIKHDNKTFKTVDSVTATLDGEEKQWSVFDRHIYSGLDSTAYWEIESFDMPDFGDNFAEQMKELMGDDLSPEHEQQLQAMQEMMQQAGPMVQALEQMGIDVDADMQDMVGVSIMAYDPNQKDIFKEGCVTIHGSFNADADSGANSNTPLSADVFYVVEQGDTMMPKVAYVSDTDDPDFPLEINFNELKLNKNGDSRAAGQFKAKLCRWERSKMMQGPQKDDCKQIEGSFDTPLVYFQDSR